MEIITSWKDDFKYAHSEDAGIDLRSIHPGSISPGEIVKVKTGTYIALPKYHFGMIVPRSGLGSRGITVSNSPGIIDSGYRGEVMVALINHGKSPFEFDDGDRIAQMVVVPFVQPYFEFVDEFSDKTSRGTGGFGSTGN